MLTGELNWLFHPATFLSGICLLLSGPVSKAAEEPCRKIEMPLVEGVTRAEIWFAPSPSRPRAVLVLCPGANGNGLALIRQRSWRKFAERENLALAGIHFESPISLLSACQGYYQTPNGSGDLLLDGLRKIYGKDLPILLFGFSGGAHFTTRFIAWKPERVLAWAAGGAGVLEPPVPQPISPPGIMACGAEDPRLGGALCYFKQGRAAGKPWIWVEMPRTGHSLTPEFENFARQYFSAILNGSPSDGLWVDIDTSIELSPKEATALPSLSGWIPARPLLASWQKCHAVPAGSLFSNQ